jgi:hypothetical protein
VNWTRIFAFLLLLAIASPLAAADRAPLFQDKAILKAVLTAPISQAYAQRDQDVRIYFPGQFTYNDSDNQTHRLEVSIRTRGHSRRDMCDFPPLQLNFKKSQVKGTLFKKQDKLKLVAPCFRGPAAQQYVLMEYLAYRIFEVLTDSSFGTRLLRLSYIDSDKMLSTRTSLVFVIEDDGAVGKRLGLDKLRVGYNEPDQLDRPTTALLELFQLMIGNNDYSILKGPDGDYCCHNIEMYVTKESADSRIAVPYDFDMSGLVNADYAVPPTHLPIKSILTRYYRGLCQPPEILDAAIETIRSKRGEIMALIGESGELSRLSTNRATRYLGNYFEMLDNSEALQEKVIDRCRGMDDLIESTAEEQPTASN